jgi:hypothetical protein
MPFFAPNLIALLLLMHNFNIASEIRANVDAYPDYFLIFRGLNCCSIPPSGKEAPLEMGDIGHFSS